MADFENRDKSLDQAKDPLVEQLEALKTKLEWGKNRENFTEQVKHTPAVSRAEQLKLAQLEAAMHGEVSPDQKPSQSQKTPDQIQQDYENGLRWNRVLDKKTATPTSPQEAMKNVAEAQGRQKEKIAAAFNNPYNPDGLKMALQNFTGNPVDTKIWDIVSPDAIKKFNNIKNTQLRPNMSLADLKRVV